MSIPNDPESYAEETVGATVKIVCKEMDIEQPSKIRGRLNGPDAFPKEIKPGGVLIF